MTTYFFDSYALIELTRGNFYYAAYTNSTIVMTIFNLAEFTYSVYNQYGKDKAVEACTKFSECVHDVDASLILEAMEFHSANKKRDLSYADCIGYIMAKKLNIKFLTGDEQFRNFPNVEFVKA